MTFILRFPKNRSSIFNTRLPDLPQVGRLRARKAAAFYAKAIIQLQQLFSHFNIQLYSKADVKARWLMRVLVLASNMRFDLLGLIKKALRDFQDEALSSEHVQIFPKADIGSVDSRLLLTGALFAVA